MKFCHGCLIWPALLALCAQVVLSASSLDRGNRNKPKVRKFIIDTDAGGDDAIAILLALLRAQKDPNIKIVAITCVNGNTNVKNAAVNVAKILAIAGEKNIPVYVGAARPLIYKSQEDFYFGKDGFGDFVWPSSIKLGTPQKQHAVIALINLAEEHKGELNVIALGPLTNLGMAIRLDPEFRKNLKRLYVMGGTVEGRGNIDLGKEFNFLADPEANYIVLNSTDTPISPVRMLPWDTIALRASITMSWRLNVLGRSNTKYTNFINDVERIALQKSASSPVWTSADPRAMASALWPELVLKSETHHVRAVMGDEGRGTLLVDYPDIYGWYKNVKIIQEFDDDSFQDILLEYFG